MKNWPAWVIVAAVVIGGTVADSAWERKQRQELAQGAYDIGIRNGRVLGMCDALASVAKANPDSEWTVNAQPALEACKPLVAKHAPGTTEAIIFGGAA